MGQSPLASLLLGLARVSRRSDLALVSDTTHERIVGVRLTQAVYAHGLALALPEEGRNGAPDRWGGALAAYEILIEGRDEWLAVAKRPACPLPAAPGPLNPAPISTAAEQLIVIGDRAQAAARLNVTWTTPLGEAVVSIA
jgi:hypothetical protein